MRCHCRSCFFFFQAEDGIRDHCVTGVQTCALPISSGPSARPVAATKPPSAATSAQPFALRTAGITAARPSKIGRASCRGKSVDPGGRRIVGKKKKKVEGHKRKISLARYVDNSHT